MARIVTNAEIASGAVFGPEKHWTYNALDCCITREVFDVLAPRIDAAARRCYDFERGLGAVAMTMMLRGVLVDELRRQEIVARLEKEKAALRKRLGELTASIWDKQERRKGKCDDGKPHKWPKVDSPTLKTKTGKPRKVPLPDDDPNNKCEKCGKGRLVAADINPLSPVQMKKLFYERLRLPEQYNHKSHLLSVDDECLEALIAKCPGHADILECVRDARHNSKQIGFLKSKTSSDGRMRSSFNVGAADTDRWSSSKCPYWEGTNLQNVSDENRCVFVADPGMLLGYVDLEQAESNVVAHDAQDEGYIKAHKSGDVHTSVARMVWTDRPWTGDLKKDRAIAEEPAPWDPYHELRWYAKHVQHGTNIGMTPVGIARDAHTTQAKAKEMQNAYFDAFPRVRARQREIDATVRETGMLVSPFGRRRQFFDRLWDSATLRKAKAQTQQHMVAWILNMAMWRIWKELDGDVNTRRNAPSVEQPNKVWLLAQEHDAILFEFREGDWQTLERVKELMAVPVKIHGRIMTIGCDLKVGKHFTKFDPKKPETVGGLAKYAVKDGKMVVFNRKEDLKS